MVRKAFCLARWFAWKRDFQAGWLELMIVNGADSGIRRLIIWKICDAISINPGPIDRGLRLTLPHVIGVGSRGAARSPAHRRPLERRPSSGPNMPHQLRSRFASIRSPQTFSYYTTSFRRPALPNRRAAFLGCEHVFLEAPGSTHERCIRSHERRSDSSDKWIKKAVESRPRRVDERST